MHVTLRDCTVSSGSAFARPTPLNTRPPTLVLPQGYSALRWLRLDCISHHLPRGKYAVPLCQGGAQPYTTQEVSLMPPPQTDQSQSHHPSRANSSLILSIPTQVPFMSLLQKRHERMSVNRKEGTNSRQKI